MQTCVKFHGYEAFPEGIHKICVTHCGYIYSTRIVLFSITSQAGRGNNGLLVGSEDNGY
jgi:hypothetical protein